jgi:hypothetical protein
MHNRICWYSIPCPLPLVLIDPVIVQPYRVERLRRRADRTMGVSRGCTRAFALDLKAEVPTGARGTGLHTDCRVPYEVREQIEHLGETSTQFWNLDMSVERSQVRVTK